MRSTGYEASASRTLAYVLGEKGKEEVRNLGRSQMVRPPGIWLPHSSQHTVHAVQPAMPCLFTKGTTVVAVQCLFCVPLPGTPESLVHFELLDAYR